MNSRVIEILIAATGLREYDLRRIIVNAPRRYKSYPIDKRGGGHRIISQPAKELKALQRALLEGILIELPIHAAAMAYRKEYSIRRNAEAHVNNGPIFKFDFKDFFPSFRARDWEYYCIKKDLFQFPEDIELTTRIFFHQPKGSVSLRLAIGAPSSPTLSNVLMYDFDTILSDLVSNDHVTYTRYADDLTFSAKRTGFLNGVEKALRNAVHQTQSPKLVINEKKTVKSTKKFKRQVTGLILTNDNKVSIGHERKRLIRSSIHYAQLGKLDSLQLAKLAGFLAFVQDVEPSFFARLVDRYGSSLMRYVKGAGRNDI